VVICTRFNEEVAAMPANSCSSVSDSPPMISVAVKRSTNTNRVLRRSSMFSINWLNFRPKYSRNIILRLAAQSSKDARDKLQFNGIPYILALKTPVIKHACAYALCRVVRRLTTGDHDLFIAKVIKAMALRDFTDDGYWRFKHYKPILYIGSIRRDPLVTI
jgi:flavin reductase (DIM6/NTAB) family NADH-FMN oxidoreductase RutF